MRNVPDISCGENQNTHFVFCNFYLENPAVYETAWKNIVEWDRPQMIIWRMRVACWITMTTDTHLEYVILPAFSLQEWLHERFSTLYVNCLSCFNGIALGDVDLRI